MATCTCVTIRFQAEAQKRPLFPPRTSNRAQEQRCTNLTSRSPKAPTFSTTRTNAIAKVIIAALHQSRKKSYRSHSYSNLPASEFRPSIRWIELGVVDYRFRGGRRVGLLVPHHRPVGSPSLLLAAAAPGRHLRGLQVVRLDGRVEESSFRHVRSARRLQFRPIGLRGGSSAGLAIGTCFRKLEYCFVKKGGRMMALMGGVQAGEERETGGTS